MQLTPDRHPVDTSSDEKDYLWDHFKFNAEQRLKAFNVFVVLSVLADSGVFAALENRADAVVFLLVGWFICVLVCTFFVIDRRSQDLLRLGVPGLKVYEQRFSKHSRIFALDETRRGGFFRYTVAFYILFAAQFLLGLGVAGYGLLRL